MVHKKLEETKEPAIVGRHFEKWFAPPRSRTIERGERGESAVHARENAGGAGLGEGGLEESTNRSNRTLIPTEGDERVHYRSLSY